ncbi:tellurium resistance protein TerD [Marinisporobacter balticus]|uniref:Tellurium resistance protein TerD n=2 Tax=Marinisporobacter balticus TaxID=2018667 RepID=A0A4R2KE09_9FIRM|nr:TerD family protein [Marinisporobacter balticus]TCO71841.1 tellurium resistance protein TerD [Marinisporobacter balticus]
MAVKLSKGQKVDLTKKNPDLKNLIIGLGWDINQGSSQFNFDLDASAFLLNRSATVSSEADFIFYNNRSGGQGSVTHSGDNKTGSGSGDDEQITVDLSLIPLSIERIAFTITINDAQKKGQNFGQISNAYIRVLDQNTSELLLEYDLGRDFSVETAIVVAELYRHQGEWKFNAIGSGFQGGLAALCKNFGLEVEEESAISIPPSNAIYQQNNSTSISNTVSPTYQQSSFQQPSYVQPQYGQPIHNHQQSGLTCPRCHSSRVTAGKKGFGIGKAVVGSLLLGPVGLLGGFIGSKNLEFLCLDCKDRWNGSSNTNTSQWLQTQANNAKAVVNRYKGADLMEALVAGSALVAIADGVIDSSERERLINYFSTSDEMKGIDINTVLSRFQYYTNRLQSDFMLGKAEGLRAIGKMRSKPDAARLIVRLCCAIGFADGEFSPVEKRIVHEICQELLLNPAEFVS